MATKRAFFYPATEHRGPAVDHRPSGAALALAAGIYVVGVAAMAWINVAVLCRGDPKWAQGCGGWLLDMVFGPLVIAPVLIAGFIAARTPRFSAWRPRLYMVSTAATLAVAACIFALGNNPFLVVFGIMAGVPVVANAVRAVGSKLISEDGPHPESR